VADNVGSGTFETGSGDVVQNAVSFKHQMHYSMWLVSVENFLSMDTGFLQCHQELLTKGKLVQWKPGDFVIFLSHQWAGKAHVDPTGHQIFVAQESLRAMVDGRLPVATDWMSQILFQDTETMTPQDRARIARGYIWLDWFAIPQVTVPVDRWAGDDISARKADLFKAVSSIPAYGEVASLLVILAPPMLHENGRHVDYNSYCSRGWCRAEQFAKILARNQGKIIVVRSSEEANYIFPVKWLFAVPADGDFADPADVNFVNSVVEASIDDRLAYAKSLESDGLFDFRFFTAMRKHLLADKSRYQEAHAGFLEKYLFRSPTQVAAHGWGPLFCAAVEGNIFAIAELVAAKADVEQRITQAEPRFFLQRGTTPLMATVLYHGEINVIEALLEHRADVNAEDATKFTPLVHAAVADRTEAVKLLIEKGALLEHQISTGGTALVGAAMYGCRHAVKVLLEGRADVNACDNFGWSSLHTASVPGDVVIAKLLIEHGAELNMAARPEGFPAVLTKVGRVARFFGAKSQLMRVLADSPGSTPLGMAALFGNVELCAALLKARADPALTNDTGHTPIDVAKINGHRQALIQQLTAVPWRHAVNYGDDSVDLVDYEKPEEVAKADSFKQALVQKLMSDGLQRQTTWMSDGLQKISRSLS
jgi:ankyrin repeat protein